MRFTTLRCRARQAREAIRTDTPLPLCCYVAGQRLLAGQLCAALSNAKVLSIAVLVKLRALSPYTSK